MSRPARITVYACDHEHPHTPRTCRPRTKSLAAQVLTPPSSPRLLVAPPAPRKVPKSKLAMEVDEEHQ